jgi:hypothetical protein
MEATPFDELAALPVPERRQSIEEVPQPVTNGRRERLRFTMFDFKRTPDGRCRAEVGLEWINDVKVRGEASGQSSDLLDLRVAAEAALRALEQFAGKSVGLELIGVKAIRAFDANVIIVSVGVRGAEEYPRRLLGSCLVETDPIRGAVLAVLNATNRILGNIIATR